MVRYNLGCGKKIMAGYVNCDLPNNWSKIKPDVECDIKKLPFEDNTADEILANHVIEHFHIWEVKDVLSEWKRVLKADGSLVLELPDLNKILFWFTQVPINPRLTFWALYGEPHVNEPYMAHHWAWTPQTLGYLLKEIGFKDVKEEKAHFHVPVRDMRITAKK